MPHCPHCATPLHTVRQREGIFYHCQTCDGRAVTLPQIRRVAGDRIASGLLRQINANQRFGPVCCPFCEQRMRVFQANDPPLELDACKLCGAVWFDPGEFESMPEGANESVHELQMRGVEAIATQRLEKLKRDQRRADAFSETGEPPDETWKTIPALFGFPVETNVDPVRNWPLATWSLAGVILLVSVLAFFDLKNVVDRFGMIPAEWWRYGGATLVTSFFLHGGILHLVGNLYFLLVFGDNVEDYLGRARYLLMILAATVVGDVVHLLSEPSSVVPCIGASGGISGIIVFYALKYPHARLGILFGYYFRFRWIQFPAWCALILWMLLQFVGVMMQLYGFSNVAATAHLGGAATGFAFWLLWRKE
ncbi:MAG TPA: rhomboid family intramembrane serine protease [Verrucomicrobiota bacterium]|nr:rhomboid family intramembrane serine protease [Verrucomicrobiota bacterium]